LVDHLHSSTTFFVFGPLLVPLPWSIGLVVAGAGPAARSRIPARGAVLYPWVVALALAYGYWTVYRGFFPEYARRAGTAARDHLPGWSLAELSQRFESGSLVRWPSCW